MKKIIKLKNDYGFVNITVIALIMLIGLTLIGISASSTSNTDILIARNLVPYKQDFYIAEGGQNKEAIKIARGDYLVTNIETSGTSLADSTGEITPGITYDYEVSYEGTHMPPSGYSSLHFRRYDYKVKTISSNSGVTINARYYTIGPKPE